MPKPGATATAESAAKPPVALVCGEDEFGVKQRARQLHQQWCAELGGMDHETIDAAAANSGEALRSLGKLREAMQTLPFFGGAKVIWFQNCSFLDDDRTARAAAVSAALGEMAQELKAFRWDGVRLLISAGKVDKRKALFKTLDKLGRVETFEPLSLDDRDWSAKAGAAAIRQLRALKKDISDQALDGLVNLVGPNLRQLESEIEKLALYSGARPRIELADVEVVVTRNKLARAFAVADALGERDLPRLFRTLDSELWEMKFDKKKSEIGLLYGVISKVRAMLFAREMTAAGWLDAKMDFNAGNAYARFKSQLERVPAGAFPEDRRFNPLGMHPFVVFGAFRQSRNYTSPELVRAMDQLLECNRRLVSGNSDDALVLQHTLSQIARKETAA